MSSLALPIIAETSDWICVNKPAGWLSVPARESADPRPVVGLYLQEQLKQQIFPVHRLDLEVSGLLVFAKNKKYQSLLNAEFERQTAHKFYAALTMKPQEGLIGPAGKNIFHHLPDFKNTPHTFEWTCLLERGKRRAFEAPYGKKSITRATCTGVWTQAVSENPVLWRSLSAPFLETQKQGVLMWILQPFTGRSHQLRYEMYRHCCPILGDTLYGYPQQQKNPAIALCHFQLETQTLGTLRLFPEPSFDGTGH